MPMIRFHSSSLRSAVVDNGAELLSRKAIEEEVSCDQIEVRRRRIPGGKLGVDELDAIDRQSVATQSFSSDLKHFFARIHTCDLRLGIAPKQRSEKFPVSFAGEQCVLKWWDIIPKGVAATFELGAGEQRFHPVVVFREVVEARNRRRLQRVGDPADESAEIPPCPGDERAKSVSHDVERVADNPAKKIRSQHFGDQRPNQEMPEDLRKCRRAIVTSKSYTPLKPENDRQCCRNEKQVVEMSLKEWPFANRLNQPAVDAIEKAG